MSSKFKLKPLATSNGAAPAGARTYHQHRARQRRRILDAAEKLFVERGIGRVTMADIVSASGLRASTLYQYFSSKEDIAWAILGEFIEELAAESKMATGAAKTAFEKIAARLEAMAVALAMKPEKVRFMAQFDAMYAQKWPAERLSALEARIDPLGVRNFSELVREGIADGSLRPDLDPDLTLPAVINALVGAQRLLAQSKERIEQEYGQPVERLFREAIRVILLGLRRPVEATESKRNETGPMRRPNKQSR